MPRELKTMRDVFIEEIYSRMKKNKSIFFLSADLGAPALDKLRKDFKDRFLNVGIAEQNLINIATGLALEGYITYAYGISAFVITRGYEPIRQNLSIASQIRSLNVNIIGIGTGLSYVLSGPSHHSLEDLILAKSLPNFVVFSPSDPILVQKFVEYSLKKNSPKYLRLDGKPLPSIYDKIKNLNLENGFYELVKGGKTCLVATGFMTHRVLNVAKRIKNVGVIDVFLLKPLNKALLTQTLKKYKYVITVEEGFINSGGLDSLVLEIIHENNLKVKFKNLGIKNSHIFELGDRNYLHKLNQLDEESIIKKIKQWKQ